MTGPSRIELRALTQSTSDSADVSRCMLQQSALQGRESQRSHFAISSTVFQRLVLLTLQALPDYLVRADAFDKGMHRIWTAGDRFRMYFGGRAGSKSGKLSQAAARRESETAPGTSDRHPSAWPWERANDWQW